MGRPFRVPIGGRMSNKRRPVRRAQPVRLRESTAVLTAPAVTTSATSGASLTGSDSYTISVTGPTPPDPARVAEAIQCATTGDAMAPTQQAPISIHEAGRTGGLAASGGRRYRARLIRPGWGSSGHYSESMLRRDAPRAFPVGTACFIDHATSLEESERPERSVRDLAARIVSTPVYENDGVYADVEVFPHAAPIIESLADHIGLSIRADGMGEVGVAEGRSGLIVTAITHGHSVDFVTAAGAGGQLVQLLESARAARLAESGSLGVGIEAMIHTAATQYADEIYSQGRMSREERITLSGAIGDALAAFVSRLESDAPQLYARDRWGDEATQPPVAGQPTAVQMGESATPSTPDTPEGDEPTQDVAGATAPVIDAPPATDDASEPDGDASADVTEPGNAPGSEPDTTQEQEEGSMPDETTQVQAREAAEAHAAALREANEARDTALREAAAMREAVARMTAVETARPIAQGLLTESDLPLAAQTRVMGQVTAEVPLTEAHALDETAFRTAVTAAITAESAYLAAVREAAGEGVPSGLGTARVTESAKPSGEFHTKLVERFVRLGMSAERAEIAARGRAA